MNYSYGELFASSVFGITSVSTLLTLAFSIVAYIFSSLALYQIAKRRGIFCGRSMVIPQRIVHT